MSTGGPSWWDVPGDRQLLAGIGTEGGWLGVRLRSRRSSGRCGRAGRMGSFAHEQAASRPCHQPVRFLGRVRPVDAGELAVGVPAAVLLRRGSGRPDRSRQLGVQGRHRPDRAIGQEIRDRSWTCRAECGNRNGEHRPSVDREQYFRYDDSAARSVGAVAAVVAFNLLMVLLAAVGQAPIAAPFFVLWFVGDFALCLAALDLTERT